MTRRGPGRLARLCGVAALASAGPASAQVIVPVQPIVPLPYAAPGPAEQDDIGSWTAVDGSINRQSPFAPSHTEVDPPKRRPPAAYRPMPPRFYGPMMSPPGLYPGG